VVAEEEPASRGSGAVRVSVVWTEPVSWAASAAVATEEAQRVSGWAPPPWSS
jgi:hypothetical protein